MFVSSEQQLIDIDRFCTKTSHFCVLDFDPAHNITSYYITIPTYRHLMFRTKEGMDPVLMGPSLSHTGRTYNSYYRLPESMIKANKNLKNILVFRTYSEKKLHDSVSSVFTFSMRLPCDLHMKDNMRSKLLELRIGNMCIASVC